MRTSFYATIGKPRLHVKDEASGFTLDLEPPRETMLAIAGETVRWLLHNGTEDEREAMRLLGVDIAEYFS